MAEAKVAVEASRCCIGVRRIYLLRVAILGCELDLAAAKGALQDSMAARRGGDGDGGGD